MYEGSSGDRCPEGVTGVVSHSISGQDGGGIGVSGEETLLNQSRGSQYQGLNVRERGSRTLKKVSSLSTTFWGLSVFRLMFRSWVYKEFTSLDLHLTTTVSNRFLSEGTLTSPSKDFVNLSHSLTGIKDSWGDRQRVQIIWIPFLRPLFVHPDLDGSPDTGPYPSTGVKGSTNRIKGTLVLYVQSYPIKRKSKFVPWSTKRPKKNFKIFWPFPLSP